MRLFQSNMSNKKYKRLVLFITVVIIFCAFFIIKFIRINSNNDKTKIQDWDLTAVGYTSDVKYSIATKLKVGIIDMNIPVYSDDLSTSKSHIDLVKLTMRKLTQDIEFEEVVLDNNCNSLEISKAIDTLIERGVRIINISLGTNNKVVFNHELVEKINENDVYIVCAGGNTNNTLLYPAACKETISVLDVNINGANNRKYQNDEKKSILAPGKHVYIDNNYYTGSSIATAYVTVGIAILIQKKPEMNRENRLKYLYSCCSNNYENSYGLINYQKLLND